MIEHDHISEDQDAVICPRFIVCRAENPLQLVGAEDREPVMGDGGKVVCGSGPGYLEHKRRHSRPEIIGNFSEKHSFSARRKELSSGLFEDSLAKILVDLVRGFLADGPTTIWGWRCFRSG